MAVLAGTDLRTFVATSLRLHPRVAYQALLSDEDVGPSVAADLPPLTPFRHDYVGAICVVDWDHALPSKSLLLRIYGFYTEESLAKGEEAYDDRLEEIGRRDVFPEFDVPDFTNLVADEAYQVDLSAEGGVGQCRFTSAWRRSIQRDDALAAIEIVTASSDFQEVRSRNPDRPARLGNLEAVSWTPPCESQQPHWTLDVWYLLAFDGHVGTGLSFLVDLEDSKLCAVRDFSVRTG